MVADEALRIAAPRLMSHAMLPTAPTILDSSNPLPRPPISKVPSIQADTTPSVPKVVNVIANRQIAPKDSYKLVLEEPRHSKSILREGILTWRNPSL